MPKEIKKDYDSTTHEPFKPSKADHTPLENPDKTKKIEKNDPTRYTDPTITSQPKNKHPKKEDEDEDTQDDNDEGSFLNRTEV